MRTSRKLETLTAPLFIIYKKPLSFTHSSNFLHKTSFLQQQQAFPLCFEALGASFDAFPVRKRLSMGSNDEGCG
jgi:hypothetical protein